MTKLILAILKKCFMLLNNFISIEQMLIPLARIFYKRIASGGLNHGLEERIGCRLNTDFTGIRNRICFAFAADALCGEF